MTPTPAPAARRPPPASLLPSAAGAASPAPPAVRRGLAAVPAGAIVGVSLLLAFALAALPVALSPSPPLFDYANHLARADAIHRFAADPLLQANYRLASLLLPNVLSDLVLVGLMQVAAPRLAGQLLLVLTFALTLAGIALLSRAAHGRWSPWSALAAVALTNEFFFWGFLNYNLGLGVVFVGLAAWVFLAERRASARVLAGAGFALLAFLCHLVAFGLYAVACLAFEVGRAWTRRRGGLPDVAKRLAFALLQLAPALVLHVAASPAGGLPLDMRFDFSAWGKVSPFFRLLSSGNPEADRWMLLALLGLAAGGLATRRARAHAGLGLAALAFAGLVLVLPYGALGSFFLDSRIAVASAFVAIAALGPGRRLGRPGTLLVCLLALGLAGWRSAVLVADWRAQSLAIDRAVGALDRLPEGALLVSASARAFELGDWRATRREKPAHEHLAAYAAIDRHLLVPNLYAKPGQNPLVFAPSLPELALLNRNPIARVPDEASLRRFVGEIAAVAARANETEPPLAGTYAVVWHKPCEDWPADLAVRRVVCRADVSVVEVLPPAAEAPPETAAGPAPSPKAVAR